MSDEFLFADEEEFAAAAPGTVLQDSGPPWKILIVDDDTEVHAVTRLALSKVRFSDRGVQLLSAYSGEEAYGVLGSNPDVALVLLDVVMETDDAGLRLARRIRDEMGNLAVRIILRTGQPGQAPEEDVIVDYDINDYKAKTELTTQKLFTTVIAALRAYAHIVALETNRRGLQQIIDSTDRLFELHSMRQFASGLLTQIAALLEVKPNGILCVQRGRDEDPEGIYVLASAGMFANAHDLPIRAVHCEGDVALADVVRAIEQAFACRHHVYQAGATALYIPSPDDHELAAWIQTGRRLTDVEWGLVEVFASKIAVCLANVRLYEKLRLANENLEQRVAERTRDLEEANTRLERLATTDSLTQAYNRRRFLELAATEVTRSRRYGRPLAVLLFDLDHFKHVNDTYGHGAGDETLRAVVRAAQNALRTNDILARYGGEEFVVMLPETDAEGARTLGERLRHAVAETTICHDGGTLTVTTSVGATVLRPDESSIEKTLARADAALYDAKRNGRNRVVLG